MYLTFQMNFRIFMPAPLTTVEISPRTSHCYTIIWLHGLGADGHDFESIVPELKLIKQDETRFIFPNAPIQAVTINGGMTMRSWYDILDRSLEHRVDISGIYHSAAQVSLIIDEQIANGIPAENILLAGFSQGGVIALHTGLRYPKRLAGIVALSTYLPTVLELDQEAAPANKTLPIFMGHGNSDPIVAIQTAQAAYKGLISKGYSVQWQEYPMQHNLCLPEIQHVAAFINSVFN